MDRKQSAQTAGPPAWPYDQWNIDQLRVGHCAEVPTATMTPRKARYKWCRQYGWQEMPSQLYPQSKGVMTGGEMTGKQGGGFSLKSLISQGISGAADTSLTYTLCACVEPGLPEILKCGGG